MVSSSDIRVFDRGLLPMRRARFADKAEHYGFLKNYAQTQLDERLEVVKREFHHCADLAHEDIEGEIEALPYAPESYDLIRSALVLHSVNDLPGVLLQIKRALKADGLFIGAMLGGETLHELRESLMQTEMRLKGGASPRVFPFADKQQMGALMQRAGFALPVIDSEIVTVSYENMFKLMEDLRGMGENNVITARSRTNPGRAFFAEAARYYAEHYGEDDGRIVARFEILYMLGWAPHESQQKPLQPGSAKARLADALGAEEETL